MGIFKKRGPNGKVLKGPAGQKKGGKNKSMASQANKDPNAPVQRKDSAEGEARRRAAGYTDDGDRLQEVGGDVTEQEAALIVMEFCRKSVLGMQEMIRQYGKMARFFVYVIVFLSVVAMQNKLGGGAVKMYKMIKDEMFADSEAFLQDDGIPTGALPATEDFYSWLETKVLSSVFRPPHCGNGRCESPEEYPQWQAATDARMFTGCIADCGLAETATYTVDFFDTHKLKHAFAEVNDALVGGHRGLAAYDYGVVSPEGAVLHTPAAGWNVCSKDKSEFGFFETVCIFDGDISVDGLPYRTKELDISSSDFGGLKQIDLFAGEWEVRLAFANFSWPSTKRGDPDVPIAFPAVRGRVCSGDRDSMVNSTCHVFAPCDVSTIVPAADDPNAYTCRGEFFGDRYYDFSESGGWGSWDDKYLEYVEDTNRKWMTAWLAEPDAAGVAPKYTFTTEASPEMLGDDDQWGPWRSAGCAAHKIRLVAVDGWGWSGSSFFHMEEAVSGRVIVDKKGEGNLKMDWYSMTGGDEKTILATLCSDVAYTITTKGGWDQWDDWGRSNVQWTVTNAELPLTADQDGYVAGTTPITNPVRQGDGRTGNDWYTSTDAWLALSTKGADVYDCPVYGYSTLGGGCEGALLSSPAPSPANPCTDGADHQITLLQHIELSLFTVTVTDVSSKKKPLVLLEYTNTPWVDRGDDEGTDMVTDTVELCADRPYILTVEAKEGCYKEDADGLLVPDDTCTCDSSCEACAGTSSKDCLSCKASASFYMDMEKCPDNDIANTGSCDGGGCSSGSGYGYGYGFGRRRDSEVDSSPVSESNLRAPRRAAEADPRRLGLFDACPTPGLTGADAYKACWVEVANVADDAGTVYRYAGMGDEECPLFGAEPRPGVSCVEAAAPGAVTFAPTANPAPTPVPTPKPTIPAPSPQPTDRPKPTNNPLPTPSPTAPVSRLTAAEVTGLWGKAWNPLAKARWDPDICTPSLMGDAVCNEPNNNLACDFDGGDCCYSTCVKTSGGKECPTKPEPDTTPDTMQCRSPIEMSDKSGKATESWPFLITSPKTVWRQGKGPVTADLEATEDDIDYRQRHVKYPYSLHTVLFQMMADEYGGGNVIPEMLPSLGCPDCNAYAGPYKSKDFTVETRDKDVATRAAKTTSPEMFPSVGGAVRERYFVEPNRVLGGVLLRQTRVELKKCESVYFEDKFGDTCPSKAHSTKAPFGVDPAFVSTSRLYRASNDAAVMAAQYPHPSEINPKGIPYGFANTQTSPEGPNGKGVADYPVLFDINMNVSRVADALTYLKDGNYIDGQTTQLTLDMIIFNRPQAVLGKVSATISPRMSGGWSFSYGIDTLDTELYDTRRNFLNSSDKMRMYMEYVFVCLLAYLLLVELYEVFEMGWKEGSPFAYFRSAGNALDLFAYLLQGLAIQMWMRYVELCEALSPEQHWDVYADYFATSRFFEAGPEMSKYQSFVASFEEAADLKTQYIVVVAIVLLCVCFQVLKNINFHPRMGIVTRTIAKAAGDLSFFLILFSIVAGMYAFFGCLVFGQEMDRFSSFANAFEAVLETCVGMYNPVDEPEFTLGKKVLAMMYFWSYIVISFFILLNALLAIVVEAYDKVQTAADEESKQDPLNFMLYEMGLHLVWPSCGYMRIAHLSKVIHDCSDPTRRNIRPWRLGLCLGTQLRHGMFPAQQSKKLLVIPKDILEQRFNTIVLDQDAVATAVEIMLPACSETSCKAIAYNLLQLLGTGGIDKDGDGKISDLEVMAFKDGQEMDLESEMATYDDKFATEHDKKEKEKKKRAVRLTRMVAF